MSDLDKIITRLQIFRQELIKHDSMYREAEICYQLISLCMGINNALKDGNFAREQEYIHEKAAMVSSLFIDFVIGKPDAI